ncbi:hypothetical protein SM22010_01750 [Xanthomonas hortorum pv. gardneri]|nr:hypothetical protein SM17710_02280 [Xanthomonas hortorum pv. gardneri]KLB06819.1 hypothetical protein SM18210_01000 [Xanthomonas hortorum pv. gardneri]KLB12111.1 hypothetical protein SM23410_04240 [Xanthomonas hortorum pv. gardneri]KLB14351.1 hypothetical protein SM22010_01750 [Xanthomonas hortorum pv. gardneri]KLB19617.1 hypothetical protein SM60511_10290 [Xanthomonas hortorum pv. gardneri]
MHQQCPSVSPFATRANGAASVSEILKNTEIVDTAVKRASDVVLVSSLHGQIQTGNEARQHLIPAALQCFVEQSGFMLLLTPVFLFFFCGANAVHVGSFGTRFFCLAIAISTPLLHGVF